MKQGHTVPMLLAMTLFFVILASFFLRESLREKFDDCWCRKQDGTTAMSGDSMGDVTNQLQRFSQIVANSHWLVGREAGSDQLYYAPKPLTTSSMWKPMGRSYLSNIALNDYYILGNNSDSSVYAADISNGLETSYSSPQFSNVPGGLAEVALVDKQMWGVASDGKIWQCDGPCQGGKWNNVPGTATGIGYDPVNKVILLRGNSNTTYKCATPCSVTAPNLVAR